MARRERDREIARRRKRTKERRKLRAKGLLPPVESVRGAEKKPKKAVWKEAPPEVSKTTTEPSTPGGQPQ